MIGTAMTHVYLLGASWFDGGQHIVDRTSALGQSAAVAMSIVFIVVAFVWKRTLGAVLAVCVVAGVVLYAVMNTSDLQNKTQTDIQTASGRAPAVVVAGPPPFLRLAA